VKGHQDSSGAILDRWATLNVLMDAQAKNFLPYARQAPRHQEVWGAPWSLWLGEKKITSDITNAIYALVHDPDSRDYWTKKPEITQEAFDLVNWASIGVAMSELKLSRRVFVAKHCSGMCGVEKFMKRWKEWDHDLCPRCGEPEDSPHVWLCTGFDANKVWETSMTTLNHWMNSVDTNPDIVEVVLELLRSWRTAQPTKDNPFAHLNQAWDNQIIVGGHRMFEGWVVRDWETLQQQYYNIIRSRRSGKRWTMEFIKKLWNIA